MDEITIRAATMADYEAVCRLTAVVDQHHAALLPTIFQPFEGPARPRDLVAELVDSLYGDYLLAEMGGRVVGYLSITTGKHPSYPMFRPYQFALIENLVVEADCRRRGVASALLAAAYQWARERGLRRIQLTVWAANSEAMAFYQRQGFQALYQRMEVELDPER